VIGIGFLVMWNLHKLYGRAREGTVDNDRKPTVSLREGPVHPSATPSIIRDVSAKTNLPSVLNILKKRNDINEAKYAQYLKYVFNSPDLCRRSGRADDVTLVVLVITYSPYFKTRQNWRNSVEIRKHEKVRVLFVVEKTRNETIAEKLRVEHKQFGDVISMNFTHENKMAESLRCLSGLRWIRNFCPQTGFVLKVGTNTMVMMSNVLEYLDNLAPNIKENLYSGRVIHRNAWVQRSGQWAATKEEWPLDNYPDYVQYFVIFLSGKSASVMADTSRKTELFKFPDVYFGILANEAEERIFATEPEGSFQVLSLSDVKDEVTDYCKMKKFLYIYSENVDDDMQKGWNTLRERKELLCPNF
jgi:hypothetical protein